MTEIEKLAGLPNTVKLDEIYRIMDLESGEWLCMRCLYMMKTALCRSAHVLTVGSSGVRELVEDDSKGRSYNPS